MPRDEDGLGEVVFFDVGGTLVESAAQPLTVAYAQTLDPPMDPETLGRAFEQVLGSPESPTEGAPVAEHIERWSESYRRVLDIAGYCGDLSEAIDAMWNFWLDLGPPYPEVNDVLEALQARSHRLGVISNWAPCLDEALVRLGLRDRFEIVVCSSLVGLRKPDPRIFMLAAERVGVTPERCTYVGDSEPVDVDGARGVGMTPVLVDRRRGGVVGGGAPSNCRVIASLGDLIR